jgi:hypothetical protein
MCVAPEAVCSSVVGFGLLPLSSHRSFNGLTLRQDARTAV